MLNSRQEKPRATIGAGSSFEVLLFWCRPAARIPVCVGLLAHMTSPKTIAPHDSSVAAFDRQGLFFSMVQALQLSLTVQFRGTGQPPGGLGQYAGNRS
jgi:hypothetical protein